MDWYYTQWFVLCSHYNQTNLSYSSTIYKYVEIYVLKPLRFLFCHTQNLLISLSFCENAIGNLLIDDRRSLVLFTRWGYMETSRNLLEIFSPFIDELSNTRTQEAAQEPQTLVLPDTEVDTVSNVMALFSWGKMHLPNLEQRQDSYLETVTESIVSLARCLGLNLTPGSDLTLDLH